MSGRLLGLLLVAGFVLYWYFLPYQAFLGLIGAGNMWGPIIANTLALCVTGIIGLCLIPMLLIGIVLLFGFPWIKWLPRVWRDD